MFQNEVVIFLVVLIGWLVVVIGSMALIAVAISKILSKIDFTEIDRLEKRRINEHERD